MAGVSYSKFFRRGSAAGWRVKNFSAAEPPVGGDDCLLELCRWNGSQPDALALNHGDDQPRPGIAVFQRTFFVSLHVSGTFASSETPGPPRPAKLRPVGCENQRTENQKKREAHDL